MGLQELPICFKCEERVDTGLVFCAPCDHDKCPSAAFHPICLMEWRQHREDRSRHMRKFLEHHEVRIGIEVRELDGEAER